MIEIPDDRRDIFHLHPYLRISDTPIALITGFSLFCMITFVMILARSGIVSPGRLFRFAAILGATILFGGGLIRILVRELRETRYSLSASRVGRYSPRGVLSIPLSEIDRFDYRSVGPWITGAVIEAKGKRMHLPLLMHNFADFIDRLKEYLPKQTNGPVYEPARIERLYARARRSDLGAMRISAFLGSLLRSTLALACLSVFVSVYFWMLPFIYSLLWVVTASLIPVLIFFLCEIIVSLQENIILHDNPRAQINPFHERLYSWALFCGALLYFGLGILYRNLSLADLGW